MFQRGAGVLLHITSLPAGNFGPSAYAFVDKLAEAGQKYWQILPLTPTSYGGSPYGSLSAFAGNTDLLTQNDQSKVDANFRHFCESNWSWLDDYALFTSLRKANEYRPWNEWQEPLRRRDRTALAYATNEHSNAIDLEKRKQYDFFCQWYALKKYANDNGVRIIGDVPIYVAFDSADVWCNQDKFKLNEHGAPAFVAGVPPDYFSNTGQLWGNPVYNWDALRADGYGWWVERVRQNLRLFDIVRLDHFIGLARAYEVPGDHPTAEHGEWQTVPGTELFLTMKNAFGSLPFIAEDLGEVTKEVEELRDSFGVAPMHVLQFAFGGDPQNTHLPHNHRTHSVVYTGTHDNETTVGWFKSGSKPRRQPHIKHCLRYLKTSGKEINWDIITAAFRSVGEIAIVPLQDILGLDNSARMNTPGTMDGNWEWRITQEQLENADWRRIREEAELYGR
jgi:4-alpha-glucanotransferase